MPARRAAARWCTCPGSSRRSPRAGPPPGPAPPRPPRHPPETTQAHTGRKQLEWIKAYERTQHEGEPRPAVCLDELPLHRLFSASSRSRDVSTGKAAYHVCPALVGDGLVEVERVHSLPPDHHWPTQRGAALELQHWNAATWKGAGVRTQPGRTCIPLQTAMQVRHKSFNIYKIC